MNIKTIPVVNKPAEIKEEAKKKFIPNKEYKRPPLIVDADNPDLVIGNIIELWLKM